MVRRHQSILSPKEDEMKFIKKIVAAALGIKNFPKGVANSASLYNDKVKNLDV